MGGPSPKLPPNISPHLSTTYPPNPPSARTRHTPNSQAKGMSKLHPQTGPVTVEGKQIASRNATTHGGTSEQLIVPGERREDFDALLNDLLDEHSPATPQARHLVEDVALARWLLWRKRRAANAVEANLYKAQPAPELWAAETYHQLALLDRYQTAAERSLQRALRNLQAHNREVRRAPKEAAQAELAAVRAADLREDREESQWNAAYNGYDRPTPYPAEQVCRKYYFPQGIPSEYHSFTSREDYRREKHHTIEQTLAPADWRELVQAEQALGTGHALLNPEGDSVS
jgi:hypothetical protein